MLGAFARQRLYNSSTPLMKAASAYCSAYHRTIGRTFEGHMVGGTGWMTPWSLRLEWIAPNVRPRPSVQRYPQLRVRACGFHCG